MAMKGAIYFLQTLAGKCQVPATLNVESQSFFYAFKPGLVQIRLLFPEILQSKAFEERGHRSGTTI